MSKFVQKFVEICDYSNCCKQLIFQGQKISQLVVVALTYDSDQGLKPGKKGQSRPGSGVGTSGTGPEN